MIKTFEQFVSTVYGRPVNEAFQSSKLRQIIKQHGKPKYSWEHKLLYDLKDNEILGVIEDENEYWDKYYYNDKQETFKIELEDGSYLIIGNLGLFKDYVLDKWEEKNKIFKERHAERHKGNLGVHYKSDHSKHLENVNKIEQRRVAEKLQDNIEEIVTKVKSMIEDIDISELEDGGYEMESEITLNGNEYNIFVYYTVEFSEKVEKYGGYYYDISYGLDNFELFNEDDICVTNDMLGITRNTYKDLFADITEKDVDGGIADPYEYYGVSRSDFF